MKLPSLSLSLSIFSQHSFSVKLKLDPVVAWPNEPNIGCLKLNLNIMLKFGWKSSDHYFYFLPRLSSRWVSTCVLTMTEYRKSVDIIKTNLLKLAWKIPLGCGNRRLPAWKSCSFWVTMTEWPVLAKFRQICQFCRYELWPFLEGLFSGLQNLCLLWFLKLALLFQHSSLLCFQLTSCKFLVGVSAKNVKVRLLNSC